MTTADPAAPDSTAPPPTAGPGTPDDLRARLVRATTPERLAWLDQALAAVAADPAAITHLFPAAGRKVGRGPLPAAPDDSALPGVAGAVGSGRAAGTLPTDPFAWTVDDAARVLLLAALGDGAGDRLADLYAQGDNAERRAVLRALPHLDPAPGDAALALVDDAVRTNDTRLIAAALGPYAAAHLVADAWRQAVLKCVFTGVPLALVAGLDQRADGELARMLTDYAHERVCAGRDVPADVWPVVARHRPAGAARLAAEADSPVPGRRDAARRALDGLAAAGWAVG